MYVSTENGPPLPVTGFSLKGAIITSDFLFFNPPLLGKREQQEGEELEEKKIASGPGNSDRKGYMGGAEGEMESETEC